MTSASDSYAQLCGEDDQLPDVFEFISNQKGLSDRETVNILLVDQFQRWKRQQAIPVDHYCERTPDIDDSLKVELLVEEFGYLEERGVAPQALEFVQRYSTLSSAALEALCDSLEVDWEGSDPLSKTIRASRTNADIPSNIGRYKVVRSIGKGTFGEVFLAKDPELQRSVAIKVPNEHRVELGGGSDEFLNEARAVAGLDHPNIVPVYDVGQTEDGRCFVVSKYVRGKELRTELRKGVDHIEAATIIAQLAGALHAAHQADIVHRDVKPGNIMIDSDRTPHLLDFGLSLRGYETQNSNVLVGTPAYMSPEQASSDGDSIDGRSDIFSLGVVFYELLTGKRPHSGSDPTKIIQLVSSGEVRPPRQIDDSIPLELERICLKSVARSVSDRYSTAKDLADELNEYLREGEYDLAAQTTKKSGSTAKLKPRVKAAPPSLYMPIQILISLVVVFALAWNFFPRTDNNGASTGEKEIENVGIIFPAYSTEAPARIAVLGFRNVANNSDDEWIGLGLAENLRFELRKSKEIQVTPSLQIQQLLSDLEITNFQSIGPSTLNRIRNLTGADIVVTGAFAPSGAAMDKVKIDVVTQYTQTDRKLSEFSKSFGRSQWTDASSLAAAKIRRDLNLQPIDLMQTGQMSAHAPQNEKAAKLYFQAKMELQKSDYLAAEELFKSAAKFAPESYVIHDSLAELYSQMGNDKLNLEHTREAVGFSSEAPPQIQRDLEARLYLLSGEPTRSVAIYQDAFDMQPSLQAGLRLARSMISAGQATDAIRVCESLENQLKTDSDAVNVKLMIADAAQSISDYTKQISAAEKAFELSQKTGSIKHQAESLLRHGLGLQRLGKNEDAISKLKQAFENFDHQNDYVGAGKSKAASAKVYVDQGELEMAERELEYAVQLAESSNNQKLQTQLLGQQGEMSIYRGKFDEATATLRKARQRFVELGDQINKAGMSLTLANVVARSGNAEQARELILEARDAFQAAGNRQGQARTWGQQGAIFGRAGDSIKARQHFERALELFREVGDRVGEATCLGDLASTYSNEGDLQKAGEMMSSALEIHREVESRHGASTIKYNLAILYIRTGRTRAAIKLLEDALATFESQGNLMNACFAKRKVGDLHMQMGELSEAGALLDEALTDAKKVGSKNVMGQALGSLAVLHYLMGDSEKSKKLHEQSIEIKKELNQEGSIASNHLHLAEIAIEENRFEEAERLSKSAEQALSLNKQGWYWIQQAIKGRVVSKNSPREAVAIFEKFNEFLENRNSQDTSIELQLMHQQARLAVAAGENEKGAVGFKATIARAAEHSMLMTELLARADLIELYHRSKTDSVELVEQTLELANKHGFKEVVKRINGLSDD